MPVHTFVGPVGHLPPNPAFAGGSSVPKFHSMLQFAASTLPSGENTGFDPSNVEPVPGTTGSAYDVTSPGYPTSIHVLTQLSTLLGSAAHDESLWDRVPICDPVNVACVWNTMGVHWFSEVVGAIDGERLGAEVVGDLDGMEVVGDSEGDCDVGSGVGLCDVGERVVGAGVGGTPRHPHTTNAVPEHASAPTASCQELGVVPE